MQIDVRMKVDEDHIATANTVAYGWVTLDELIKFPVSVRKYTDKTDNKEKLFVAYPQRKTSEGYEYVCLPTDPKLRKEIDEKVLLQVRETIMRPLKRAEIDKVRVSLLDPENSRGTVKNVGIATIETAGIRISGVMIKEGPKGLSVQMPQHMSKEKYVDTVFPLTRGMYDEIKDAVLWAYRDELREQQEIAQGLSQDEEPKEKPDTPMKGFMEEYEKNFMPVPPKKSPEALGEELQRTLEIQDLYKTQFAYDDFMKGYKKHRVYDMLDAAEHAQVEITQTGIAEDGVMEFQEAVIRNEGKPPITLVYGSDYRPSSDAERKGSVQLLAFVPKDDGGKEVEVVTLEEFKDIIPELKNAHERVLDCWNKITAPKKTELPSQGTYLPSHEENAHPIRPNALMTQPRR